MPEPVRGNFQLINIVAGDRLRSGDVISARIRDILPDGRIRLDWNGRILTARSVLSFQPGQLIRATVDKNPRGFYLHLQQAAGTGRPGTSLPHAASGTLLSAALFRSGLPMPDAAEAARRGALLSRTKGNTLRVSRTYAEILAKGGDPTAGLLESLDLLFSGDDDSREGHPGHREWKAPPAFDELTEDITENPGDEIPLFGLLNSLPGKNGHWMFARNSRRAGGHNLEMTWKFRRGIHPALALTVRDGSRTLEFLLEGLDHTRLTVHSDNPGNITAKTWRGFRQRLALMNIEVDDTILPIEESDGFTPGTGEVIRDLENRG